MGKLTERVAALAGPIAAQAGCTVWDVEYVKEAGSWYLRVYLDSPDGVDLDKCEAVSRALGERLDSEDPVEDSYIFEVSSPGADRVLKRPSDFQQFMGEKVTVKLYRARDGRKELVGALRGYEDGDLLLEIGEETLRLSKKEVAQVRLYVQW